MSTEDAVSRETLKNPEKIYSFTVLRPGGNDTALVVGVVENPMIRKEVNDQIMQFYPNVEQVGFVNLDPGKPELMMAGGEFCGNATRSTAWLALDGKPGELAIKVSGVAKRLKAGVTENGEAFAQMPIYSDASKISADPDAPDNRIVEMEGITQYINFNIAEIEGLSPEETKAKAKALIVKKGLDRFPAAGVMYTQKDGDSWRITPVVWVRDIDTLYLETACGSGTTALGLVLALQKGSSISQVPIMQPTGLPIKVSVDFDGQAFGYAQISGPVDKLTEGVLRTKEQDIYVIESVTSQKDLDQALDKGGLMTLYQKIFGEAPYFETFMDQDVRTIFEEYVNRGMLFLARSRDEVVGFGAALPMSSVPEIAAIAGVQSQPERAWYMADLGVKKEFRNCGIGRNLVIARLDRMKGKKAVMRTSINNIASQSLYRSLGFRLIDGAVQFCPDKRIFLEKEI